ncbi:hypothetical protein [Bradyrhizobium sp. SZCCHNPS1003]|uniref:hypothetical protein n=1 Tax=Bradyrhizobium sp. SZCCHNPS1003 TaxID=3057330 RepID=UPI0028EB54D6|nr:hypothetical protein [Bradyrhizobium sp. SZCCHNPS1003]
MLVFGILDKVEALIEQQGGSTKITWDYATVFDRHDPLILSLSAALDPPVTAEQIDAMFELAATL